MTEGTSVPSDDGRRVKRLSQTDVPSVTLQDARRVAEAIRDEFAMETTSPFNLPVAFEMVPGVGRSGS